MRLVSVEGGLSLTGDDSSEALVRICGVVDSAKASVGLHQAVASSHLAMNPGLALFLHVSGMSVCHSVLEHVVLGVLILPHTKHTRSYLNSSDQKKSTSKSRACEA